MNQSHRDRLISSLPVDLQARVLKSLQDYSSDGNDAVEACFAAVIVTNQRESAQLRQEVLTLSKKLAESEERENTHTTQITSQITQTNADNEKIIRQEINALSGKTLWKRIIASRLIGGGIWFAMVIGLTPYVVEKQVRTVDPEFHAMIEKLGAQSKTQQEHLDMVMRNQEKTVEFIEEVRQSTSIITTNTSVGQTMARYITSTDRHTITLAIPDPTTANGTRILSVPHMMTDDEYTKFKLAYFINKKIK